MRLRRIGLVVTLALGVLAAPLAAKRATNTIPIVMTNAGDPVGSGLVTSLGRPGGNVTGLSLLAPAVVGKQLELLKEVVPKVNRVAVLTNPGSPTRALMLTEAEAAMRPLGLRFQILDARGPGEFEAAFSAMTIGGGIGHLTRKCGLSIDNLLSVDMVLADGRFVTASAEENEDLFWAVRGGGGNFGAVTSFLFRLHPIKTIIGGPTLWTLEQAADVMKWYREFITTAPDDLNGFFAFLTVPPALPFPENLHLKKMCGVVWCYTGPEKEAERVFKPIREFGPPALYGIHAMPHPMLQSAFDALYPPGLQWYWRADFVKELSDEAIALHVKHGSDVPTMHSAMHLYPINGGAQRVGKTETPWSYRDATWAEVIVGVDPDPANTKRITEWSKTYWDALHPYSAGGAYVNFMMDEGEERIKATYRDNYPRLASLKKKYDPTNLFRVNQNIKPAA